MTRYYIAKLMPVFFLASAATQPAECSKHWLLLYRFGSASLRLVYLVVIVVGGKKRASRWIVPHSLKCFKLPESSSALPIQRSCHLLSCSHIALNTLCILADSPCLLLTLIILRQPSYIVKKSIRTITLQLVMLHHIDVGGFNWILIL